MKEYRGVNYIIFDVDVESNDVALVDFLSVLVEHSCELFNFESIGIHIWIVQEIQILNTVDWRLSAIDG